MKLKKLIKGKALYVTPEKIWVAQGMTFFALDYNGKRVSRKYRVGSLKDRVLNCMRLSRQLLRVGLHHLLPLKNGNILVVAKRKTYIVSPEGNVVNVFQGYQGNKPGHQGVCVTPDGTIFFAEYLLNFNRDHFIRLYRSTDDGMSFHVVKEWEAGDIRHLHFVKWDEYETCLWLGTGDYGENGCENRLYKSTDNGDTWELIGQYSQDWRAIGVCFTEDALTWGTDAGSCPDTVHFVKMDRKTQKLEILEDFEGPCHGCASYKDGRAFFSTGVEGGENEKDRFARLKEYKNGRCENIWKLEKDIWPLILQYGVMRFPLGTDQCTKVVFTTMGLKRHGETVMIEK
ncbi:hypothetical protein [uncultured Bacteroides sp.]|uniref:hypothetical protein n=1 Tax=uncultured Bacteroides sp. TaxID=162156 RepID=UPI002AA85544|nr:hypothetical protein [uncultured Bacteroides sp.]